MHKRISLWGLVFLLQLIVLSCGSNGGNGVLPPDPSEEGGTTGGTTPEVTYQPTKLVTLAKLVDTPKDTIAKLFSDTRQTTQDTIKVSVMDEFKFRYTAAFVIENDKLIRRIELTPITNDTVSDINKFKKIVNSAMVSRLGSFYGTLFTNTSTSEGGLKQSVAETIPLLDQANVMKINTRFGTTKKGYTVVYLNYQRLKVVFCRNYFPLDFSTIHTFIGREISDIQQQYYEVCNKVQYGTSFVNLLFPSAIDPFAQEYEMNMDTGSDLTRVKEVSIYIKEEGQIINRWKDLLLHSDKYRLGSNPVYYVNDQFGDKIKDLSGPEEAISIYEENGRANGIVARFDNPIGYTSVILNKDYCYILLTKKP